MLLSAANHTKEKTMTLTLAIAFNAALVLALLVALATVMSRAARLKPHVSAAHQPSFEPIVLSRDVRTRRARRPEVAFADARL
jgi:hypothetical protein